MELNITSEQEKQRVGGYIYENCHKFPTLYVNSENSETYLNHLEAVSNIVDMSGPYLMLLFSEICSINGATEPEEIELLNKTRNNFFLECISKVSLCLIQCNEIINKIKSSECLEIYGKDYCFIVITINELFSMYSGFIFEIRNHKYCDQMFVKSEDHQISTEAIQGVLAFLISGEFEEIRKFFRIIECIHSVLKSATIH